MNGATAETYEWLCREFTDDAHDTWLFATFVRDLPPRAALLSRTSA